MNRFMRLVFVAAVLVGFIGGSAGVLADEGSTLPKAKAQVATLEEVKKEGDLTVCLDGSPNCLLFYHSKASSKEQLDIAFAETAQLLKRCSSDSKLRVVKIDLDAEGGFGPKAYRSFTKGERTPQGADLPNKTEVTLVAYKANPAYPSGKFDLKLPPVMVRLPGGDPEFFTNMVKEYLSNSFGMEVPPIVSSSPLAKNEKK